MAITILDEPLKTGQIKSVTSDAGRHIDYISLLFSDTTKAEFKPNDVQTGIVLSVSDNNLDLPEMVCEISAGTLRDLITCLKNMYNQLDFKAIENETKVDNDVKESEKTVHTGCCRKKIIL